jgi:hypothetical protein
MTKLVTMVTMIVLGVVAVHAWDSATRNSPASPTSLLHNAVAGLCADQDATAAADGSSVTEPSGVLPSGGTVPLAGGSSVNVSTLDALAKSVGGSLSCSTTTTTALP